MAEIKQYRGLEAIGKRIGYHPLTVLRKIKNDGFLAYKIRTGKGWETMWITDDHLIELWQLAKCKADQERLLARRKSPENQTTRLVRQCPAG